MGDDKKLKGNPTAPEAVFGAASSKAVDLLDLVRGFAILAVMAFHSYSSVFGCDGPGWNGWHPDFAVNSGQWWLWPASLGGSIGVAAFFVVSGFCIHLSFRRGAGSWGAFYLRRFFRIYPAYVAAILFLLILDRANSGVEVGMGEKLRQLWSDLNPAGWLNWSSGAAGAQVFSHLLMLHNYNSATFSGITGAMWSLAVECQLYLAYPLLLLLVSRLGWRNSLVGLLFLEAGLRVADASCSMAGLDAPWRQWVGWLAVSPLGYWFSWALGAALAESWIGGRAFSLACCPGWLWLTLALACHLIRPLSGLDFPLLALFTGGLVGRSLGWSEGKPVLFPWLDRVLGAVGRSSYSLYLIHQPLINLSSTALGVWLPALGAVWGWKYLLVVLCWFPVIGLSLEWRKTLEEPGIVLGKKVVGWVGGQRLSLHISRGIALRGAIRIGVLSLVGLGCIWASDRLALPTPEQENNAAWKLATGPDPAHRDGALAVKLAEDACRRNNGQMTVLIGTLAASYAEARRFDEAIATAQKACDSARVKGETELLRRNQELLELYRQHQAYHEPPAQSPAHE